MRIVAVTLFMAIASPCFGQGFEPSHVALERLKQTTFQHHRPQAIVVSSADREARRTSISVFAASSASSGADRVWVLRRELTDVSGVTVSWADDRACPQVLATLDGLQRLAIPSLRFGSLAGSTPGAVPPPVIVPMHSAEHMVWGYGRAEDNNRVEVVLTSRVGGLAIWAGDATTSLAPCWNPDEPVLP